MLNIILCLNINMNHLPFVQKPRLHLKPLLKFVYLYCIDLSYNIGYKAYNMPLTHFIDTLCHQEPGCFQIIIIIIIPKHYVK